MIEKYKKQISEILDLKVDFQIYDKYKKINRSLNEYDVIYVKGTGEGLRVNVIDTDKKEFFNVIANFFLVEMPGCCGVCISYNSAVLFPYRQKGIGTILHKMRIEIAKKLDFTVMMCTDREANSPQKKILQDNGWKSIDQFKNKRTNNLVNISVLHLD